MESALFPSLVDSLTRIAERSTNETFARKFNRITKRIRKANDSSMSRSVDALHGCIGSAQTDDDHVAVPRSQPDTICQAFEYLFRQGIRPALFKGTRRKSSSNELEADEDDARFFNLAQNDSLAKDDPPAEIFDDALTDNDIPLDDDDDGHWHELELEDDETSDEDLWDGYLDTSSPRDGADSAVFIDEYEDSPILICSPLLIPHSQDSSSSHDSINVCGENNTGSSLSSHGLMITDDKFRA